MNKDEFIRLTQKKEMDIILDIIRYRREMSIFYNFKLLQSNFLGHKKFSGTGNLHSGE